MQEPSYRYHLERKATKLPAEYGDPPYRLIWSLSDEQAANKLMAEEVADNGDLYEYRVVDTGAELF